MKNRDAVQETSAETSIVPALVEASADPEANTQANANVVADFMAHLRARVAAADAVHRVRFDKTMLPSKPHHGRAKPAQEAPTWLKQTTPAKQRQPSIPVEKTLNRKPGRPKARRF